MLPLEKYRVDSNTHLEQKEKEILDLLYSREPSDKMIENKRISLFKHEIEIVSNLKKESFFLQQVDVVQSWYILHEHWAVSIPRLIASWSLDI